MGEYDVTMTEIPALAPPPPLPPREIPTFLQKKAFIAANLRVVPPTAKHVQVDTKVSSVAQEVVQKEAEEPKATTHPSLARRIGTSIEKFFTERLRQFFRGIALAFKKGADKETLIRDVNEAVTYINTSSKEKFQNIGEAPFLSYSDAAFMKKVSKKSHFSGMQMARILDIKEKVEQRVELYHAIDVISSNTEEFGIDFDSKEYDLILNAVKKLAGEDRDPAPLSKGERKALNKVNPIRSTIDLELHKLNTEDGRQQYFDELSNQILVPVETLQKKYQGLSLQEFSVYVAKKKHKYGNVIAQAKVDYDEIFARYEEARDAGQTGTLKPRSDNIDGEAVPGLTKETLMKVVRKANLALIQAPREDVGAAAYSKKHDWHLLAVREDGHLQVAKWSGVEMLDKSHEDYLGDGAYGVVQKVYDIANARITALKLAKTFSEEKESIDEEMPEAMAQITTVSEKARDDVINEAVKMRHITNNEDSEGLQEGPKAIFKISGGVDGKPINGYMGKYYNMRSVEKVLENKESPFHSLSKKEKLAIVLSLLKGLETLQKETKERGKIVHGDIKPGNFFIHQRKDGTYEVVIGDFGDAKDLTTELPRPDRPTGNNIPGTVYTPGFWTLEDMRRLSKANSQEQWEQYQAKRDLFATAASIWEMLTGKQAFEVRFGRFADTDIAANELPGLEYFRNTYGNDLTPLFQRALDEDPDNRPSVSEMIEAVNKELSKG